MSKEKNATSTTVTDFSIRTGYSVDRIRQLIDAGKIPADRLPNGWRLPHLDAVPEWQKKKKSK